VPAADKTVAASKTALAVSMLACVEGTVRSLVKHPVGSVSSREVAPQLATQPMDSPGKSESIWLEFSVVLVDEALAADEALAETPVVVVRCRRWMR
jgi:hypothetical protein